MANKKSQSKSTSTTQRSLSAVHRAVYDRVTKMTAKEGFRTLVASGIYTQNGNLSRRYGG
jgi:hypothetical protein